MARKKKETETPVVTFIEDPYQFKTDEVLAAQQNDTDDLNLDAELEEILEEAKAEEAMAEDAMAEEAKMEEPFEIDSSESLDDQLDKLAQAISDQAEKESSTAEETTVQEGFDSEAELALQIAEDQALEAQEILEAQESAQESAQECKDTLDAAGLEAQPSAAELDLEELQSCMEALIYIADKPISLEKLRGHLGPNFPAERFQEAIAALTQRYQGVHHGIELVEVSGGYQFRTKLGRTQLAQKLVKVQTQRLSTGAMETLAIIAYKQPLMKEDVDKIRGVDSSYFVRGLLERKLIMIAGRSELPGRPILYTTTPEFLEIFGLKDLNSMPSLRELEQMIPSSESRNPEDEDPKIRELRRLVGEMKANRESILNYDPKEDEKILKDIRERVNAIPTSSPYLDELKAAEQLAVQQAKAEAAALAAGIPLPQATPENSETNSESPQLESN